MHFYLFHQLWRDFFFRFAYCASNPQTTVHVDGFSTPKSSSCSFFRLPPFSPLCQTYVQRASSWTRLSFFASFNMLKLLYIISRFFQLLISIFLFYPFYFMIS